MKNLLIGITLFFLSSDLIAQHNYTNIVDFLNSHVRDSLILCDGDLKVYNVYKFEYYCLYNYYKNRDTTQYYSNFYATSIVPFAPLWKMFGTDPKSLIKHFIDKENEVNFDSMSNNVMSISSANLDSLFTSIATRMNDLTGYKIRGKWYVCMLGNNMCDLCGNGNIMLIDLLNKKANNEHIRLSLPHEFNHQILIAAKSSDSLAMSGFGAFINEGMAEYVKYIFWEKVYSPQQVMGYTNDEYRWCIENEAKILNDAQKLYLSRNWEEVKKYLFANSKVYDDGPSRLGYFIGFRICQKYVGKYGKDAWKDFYQLPFIEIMNRL